MVARDALSAGEHAVSTKPMETTVVRCDAMIEAARRRNLILAIDFGNRYRLPVYQQPPSLQQSKTRT